MFPTTVRSQYSYLFGTGMLPVLEELFTHEFAMHPSERARLFKNVPWDRDIWQSAELNDLDLFKQIPEGTEYSMSRPKQGASKTITINKYGLGISISEELVADGKFDLLANMVRKLARSGRESQEIAAFDLFNSGFSTQTTWDGLSIFNSAHTLAGGATFRNRLAVDADLSVSSLDQALSDFETQFVGDTGYKYNLRPRYLVVHPSNKRYAMELVGSTLKADTADNNMNSFLQDGLTVVSSPYLTDTDAWFLVGAPEDTGLRIIEREPLMTKADDGSVGFMSDSIVYKARYREGIAATNPYGVFGSPGA